MKKIAVMSGKGGVGKSSVSILLATALSESRKVLLLDFDLCGPSSVKALSAVGDIRKAAKGLTPIMVKQGLWVLSMGLMMKDDDALIWRGPKKLHLLEMFYESIEGFDYVVLDTPPGISEEHSFLTDKDISCVIVTTSQNIALSDSMRAIEFCLEYDINILGVIENMSGYTCPCCGKTNSIFASRGGELLATDYNLPFLCTLPVETQFSYSLDTGDYIKKYDELESFQIVKNIMDKFTR